MKKTHLTRPKPLTAAAKGGLDPGVSFSIRPAAKPDVRALLEMIRELAAFEHLEKEVAATAASLANALFGPERVAYALLAKGAGKALGYAIYYHTFSSFAGRKGIFLEDVFVRPAHRRHGIGRALLERTARIGADLNCGRFEWIALRWNKSALRFYKQLGAAKMNEWVLLRMDSKAMTGLASSSKPGTAKPNKTKSEGKL
jgi:GNAT superfamily N-acetyltransferase